MVAQEAKVEKALSVQKFTKGNLTRRMSAEPSRRTPYPSALQNFIFVGQKNDYSTKPKLRKELVSPTYKSCHFLLSPWPTSVPNRHSCHAYS